VDYFSLDIEGPELEVLETLPWDKVDITAISVETEFYGEFEDKKQAIHQLLEQQGYCLPFLTPEKMSSHLVDERSYG
jgi:Methyltransferase FkbM domain